MISPSGCGVFGVLRKPNAPKVEGKKVVEAIDLVRFRGSDKGAGFAVFNLREGNTYVVKVFYDGDKEELKRILEDNGIKVVGESATYGELCDCKFEITLGNITQLKKLTRNLNETLWEKRKGRVYSVGKGLDVFKGVGYPKDIANAYDVEKYSGDMWLAHTRQPTNSPGHFPYWSHPFSTFDVAIVHNGDVSSFGANVEFLTSRGWGGFVGTDSEVMAFLFEELVSEGLSVEEAVKVMMNPSRKSGLLSPEEDYMYRNARLDGPFTAIIGYNSGDDLYMIGIADRSKFRPVIIGEDEHYYYIASEESQIRLLSRNARVWTLSPGSYFIASLKRGVINYGRTVEELESFSPPPTFTTSDYDIDASKVGYKDLNREIMKVDKKEVKVINVMSHRFIGISFPRAGKIVRLYGVVGNVLANLNENNEFYVYGNVADDCCDTMHGGKVVIFGDARDVLGQALQGGKVFVKGNAGNRVGIQMREYQNKRPYLLIGGRVDDYLGEYMAGGVIVVFNNTKSSPTGNYVGSGMVGGRIYVRGRLDPGRLGLQPNKVEVIKLLKALMLDNLITEKEMDELRDLPYIELMDKLQGDAKRFAKKMFEEKVGIPTYEYRELTEEEVKELLPVVSEYDRDLGTKYVDFLGEKFTVVRPRKD